MFILRKILNSGSNVPDLMKLPAQAGTAYKANTPLIVEGGVLINARESNKPQYMSAETRVAGENDYLLCYRVFPNMLFEAPMIAGLSKLKFGMTLHPYMSESGFVEVLCDDDVTGPATVVDTNDAKEAGDTVFVIFE